MYFFYDHELGTCPAITHRPYNTSCVAFEFNACLNCDNVKALIDIDVQLAKGCIVANIHPNFQVDVLGYVRLPASKSIHKHKRIIETGQVGQVR